MDSEHRLNRPSILSWQRVLRRQRASIYSITGLALAYAILSLLIVYVLFQMWPETDTSPLITANTANESASSISTSLFGRPWSISAEQRLILIVILSGALGGSIHAASSFVTFVGNRQFFRSWILWYALRPFIGMALALIFYFFLRGGLFSAGADVSTVNPFGVATIAGITGMFSKQAIDKLKELFDTMFGSSEDEKRGDKEAPPLAAGASPARRPLTPPSALPTSDGTLPTPSAPTPLGPPPAPGGALPESDAPTPPRS